MFEFQPHAYNQHAARRVEGILTGRRVDATIHLVEKIVDADTWLDEQSFNNIKTMGGVQVPDAKAWSILIPACVVCLRL